MKKGILATLSALIGAGTGAAITYKTGKEKNKKEIELNEKNDAILKVFSKWMNIKNQGKSLSDFFRANGYNSIAVYGMHYLGECLVNELKDTDVQVKYAIDRNADYIEGDIAIVRPEEKLKSVDVVVVTAIYFFDEIEEMLYEKVDCPIISLEDIIYELE